jgi:hypothetical protein
METIEVVIKIPQEVLNTIWAYVESGIHDKNIVRYTAYKAIANGTVLQKGHWIKQPRCEGDEQPDLVCPNCGFKISWWDMGNFCAKCGTGLEGGAG